MLVSAVAEVDDRLIAEWDRAIAESDRCSVVRTRNRTVAILFNQKTACRTMFGRATSRATGYSYIAKMSDKEVIVADMLHELVPIIVTVHIECACSLCLYAHLLVSQPYTHGSGSSFNSKCQ